MVIRKRIQSYPLEEVELSSVISELRPMKMLVEIAKGILKMKKIIFP